MHDTKSSSKNKIRRLVLASQSPRRSELLRQAGFEFTVSSVQISEIPDENLNLQDQIRGLAVAKAEACLNAGKVAKGRGNLLLSADTVVVLDDQILGKPGNRLKNAQYLRRLSGRVHTVITGVCLLDVDTDQRAVGHETSTIEFKNLDDADIEAYCAGGDGLDKAGGYGIQSPRASDFVARVNGARDNIVGLPVALVEKLLREQGWYVDRR